MAVTFNDLIYSCYCSRPRYTNNIVDFSENQTYYQYKSPELEKSKAFSKFMKLSLDSDVLEIPCVYKYIVSNVLKENMYRLKIGDKDKMVSDLYIPMFYKDQDNRVARTSSTALRSFFYETSPSCNLLLRKAGNTTYLGGQGIILYEDYTPLVMFTMEIEREEYSYKSKQLILRVNPIIFNRDDILAKYLRGKFISNLLEMPPTAPLHASASTHLRNTRGLYLDRNLTWKFRIIIDDFSDFFVTPTIPTSSFNTEEVNNLLNANVEEILSTIRND